MDCNLVKSGNHPVWSTLVEEGFNPFVFKYQILHCQRWNHWLHKEAMAPIIIQKT